MPNTYTQIHIQTVFTVQNRMSLIRTAWQEELYRYVTGIVQNHGHKVLAINGMPDHVHLFFGMRPSQSLSDLMQAVKGDSSKWINEKQFVRGRFSWQDGYGAFSSRIIHEAWASNPFNALSVGKEFQRKDGSQFTRPVSSIIPERLTLVGKSLPFENMTPVVVNNSGSYSKSHVPNVIQYIRNQEEHHRTRTFIEEYHDLLEKFGVAFEQRYSFTPVEYGNDADE